jgi:death-on-curing protein
VKFVWLDARHAIAVHAEQIAQFGGQAGVRDQAMLESAMARPRNKAAYGEGTVFGLAAAYAFGLARNHPFLDGNKRTALVCAFAFMELNGWEVRAPEPEAALTFLALAEGKLTEAALAEWLKQNSTRRKTRT